MNYSQTLEERARASLPKRKALPKPKDITQMSVVQPDSPAPAVQALVKEHGPEHVTRTLNAWENRVRGVPIVDIAAGLNVSIETAKEWISEAHQAVGEDLKETLAQNREMDLHRLDGLIRYWYPLATNGDEPAANVVLKCIQQRARLVGAEALPDPGRQQPQNILIWIQNQLPKIASMVDALPIE